MQTIGGSPSSEKRPEQFEPLFAAALLATGAGVGVGKRPPRPERGCRSARRQRTGKATHNAGRQRDEPRWCEHRRRHPGIVQSRPIVARSERAHHTVLRQLMPVDVVCATPGEHRTIALKACPVAGFLMTVKHKAANSVAQTLEEFRDRKSVV